MKIAVFGATGKTGTEIIKQALDKGHTLSAFVRDPARLPVKDDRISLFTGDIFDETKVNEAVQGQDAVIVALGAGQSLGKTSIRATGTENIINAMRIHGVSRLIVMTAMGTGESWKDLSLINRAFYATLLRSSLKDHNAQEIVIKTSTLDWTIIRPSGLTDEPRTGEYDYGENIRSKTSRIPRADVADLMLKAIEEKSLIGKALTITK